MSKNTKNAYKCSKSNTKISSKNKKSVPNKKLSKRKIILEMQDSDDEIFEKPQPLSDSISNTKSIDTIEKQIEKIRNALKENYIQQKKLMHDLDELMTIHGKFSKTDNGTNKAKFERQLIFNSEPIPLPLKKLLKIDSDSMPRSQVIKLMHQYFIDNKLCDTKTKKISANKKLIEIFKMEENDVIDYYNLQSWLKKLYNENAPSSKNNL
jgi:hypothetical protein